MPRQSIVTFVEIGADEFMFNMAFDCPDVRWHGSIPTASQRASIAAFYGFEVEEESECQVHAMLTYRDYARLAAQRIFPDMKWDRQSLIARAIAAFISQDRNIRSDVRAWSDRRWRSGSDPDEAIKSIKRTAHFAAVEEFAHRVVADARDAGATL